MGDLLFPVREGVVTCGYYDARPYSVPVEQRTRIHKAWDIAHLSRDRAPIVAPESGDLYLHVIIRAPTDYKGDRYWPDGLWYAFSNFYLDNYGGVTLFHGDSGYWYVFAHQDMDKLFGVAQEYEIIGDWNRWKRVGEDYDRYVQSFLNLDAPVGVDAGETIGFVGNSGYSTGYHVHMQVHKDRTYGSRIDPAELWPDVYIEGNGDGPVKGPKR